MKLWEKGTLSSERVQDFTAGKDRLLDLRLAQADIEGTMAHARMLESIGLLTYEELIRLGTELESLHKLAVEGKLVIENGVEDIHSQIEMLLTRKLGDIGKRIHAGRSRNDQVLTDIKIYFRTALREVIDRTAALAYHLLELSELNKTLLLPGYTHFQVAMPSSFGLWFGCYAESLTDDLDIMEAAVRMANRNPLGSAAGYGTSLAINRGMTTRLLGFSDMHHNVVYAQMARGKTELIVAEALASIAGTLAKMASDVCLYMSQDLGFVSLPDHFTTGSSLMPHKKNPDAFELIRGRSNQIQSIPSQVMLVLANLPSGYHRDLQLLKEILFPAFDSLNYCLEMASLLLPSLILTKDILKRDKYNNLFSVDAVNTLLATGVPFREAYQMVAAEIAAGNFKPAKSLVHSHEGSMGNLHNEEIGMNLRGKLDRFEKEHFDSIDLAIANLFVISKP